MQQTSENINLHLRNLKFPQKIATKYKTEIRTNQKQSKANLLIYVMHNLK